MIDYALKNLLALGLSVSAMSLVGCAVAPQDSLEATSSTSQSLVEGAEAPSAAAPAGTLLLMGTIKDSTSFKNAVPGVAVKLTLPDGTTRVSNANANGVYRFSNLAAGTYTVTPAKAGASFLPTTSSVPLSANAESSFSCVGGCDGVATVNPLKELVIVDPAVTGDARASSATDGHWSFRFLMEQMAGTTDPSDFVLNWLQGFKSSAGPVNGFPVLDRSVDANLIAPWPKLANGKLDLSKAPFRLLAIVNRTDLHETGDGEARFVFGLVGFPPNQTSGESFTVIFEYRLPTVDVATSASLTRLSWISQFHALGTSSGSTLNTQLQAITDKFVTAGRVPANPNGSAISQVRSNEIQFGNPWELREFHLVKNASGAGLLKLSAPGQTPDSTLNGTASVANYITANRFRVVAGLATVTNTLIGGESLENNFASGVKVWDFPSFPAIDEQARHAFAGQTCNGCHNGETTQLSSFYHVSPLAAPVGDGTNVISDFIKNNELPRRRRFMQNRLACKPDLTDCASGAEALL